MKSWRDLPIAARTFIVVWLAIQILYPLRGVGLEEVPERFVWRMFSTFVAAPEYIVTTPDSTTLIDLNDVTARLRADLPFERFLPQHLCETFPDAVTVSWAGGESGSRVRHTMTISARPLAITRMIVGIAALIRSGVAWQILSNFNSPGIMKTPVVSWLPEPGGTAGFAVIGIWIVASLLFIVGWKVRLSGSVLFVAVTTYEFMDYQTYSNHLYLMMAMVLLLVVADSGAAHALGGQERQVPIWPVVLIRMQVSIVYFYAAVLKFNGDFLGGSVIAGQLDGGFLTWPMAWRTHFILSSLAVGAVAAELFVAFYLWRPSLRGAATIAGVGLHVTIMLLLHPFFELLVFSLLMFSAYLLHIDRRPIQVVWDDDCGSCQAWIQRFMRYDALGLLEPKGKSDPSHGIDATAVEHSMHVVTPDHTSTGFAAVTDVLERTVPTLYVAPLLRLPVVRTLGERWYRRQADRRNCVHFVILLSARYDSPIGESHRHRLQQVSACDPLARRWGSSSTA